MDCSTPGFPVHHQLPDHFTFTVCYTLQTCHLILHDNLPPFYRWKTRRQQSSRQYPFKIAGLEFNIHPSLQSNTWNFRLQITNLPPQRSNWKNHIAMETTESIVLYKSCPLTLTQYPGRQSSSERSKLCFSFAKKFSYCTSGQKIWSKKLAVRRQSERFSHWGDS